MQTHFSETVKEQNKLFLCCQQEKSSRDALLWRIRDTSFRDSYLSVWFFLPLVVLNGNYYVRTVTSVLSRNKLFI